MAQYNSDETLTVEERIRKANPNQADEILAMLDASRKNRLRRTPNFGGSGGVIKELFKSGGFRYPLEALTETTDYMSFTVVEYQSVKARSGGANYIYSVLMGYDEPPAGMELDDGVYYNKYMYGNKIKMPPQLYDDLVTYIDGTPATPEQMAKDVTTFMMWAAEPHLEARHKTGFRVIVYLIILTILVYFSMKKIWSRIETKV